MTETVEQIARRAMTDPQRMLWRDDVEGICPSPEMCFEYGEHVRCGPCAIRQADAHGVETHHSVPNLPEVCRLRRELADARRPEPALQPEGITPAETIGHLARRILQLAPEAGLYVAIKIKPAPSKEREYDHG